MALPSLLFNTQRFILKERKYFALAKSVCSCVDINIKTLQLSHYHTSDVLLKRRKTQEERKSSRIIEFSPKSKLEVIDVWKNITIGEISEILNKDVNYVSDLFLNEFKGKNTAITDVSKLNEAIRRSGRKTRIIKKPVEFDGDALEKDVYPRAAPKKDELQPRPPVITVMGHVDHGKTTLLDALRNTRVVDKEFGGITQHIGAFSLELKSGNKITFLDTPGHAAFSSMRQRGANITDMVVLVVAADDGVMEQTVESVKMARLANVPIIVAINKIDAPNADVDRTERMLMELGIQTESTGGSVQAVPISALKKINLDQLTEALIVQAEMLEIGGDPNGPVEAVVVESRVDSYRGRLCTVIVQRGTLKKGDILITDTALCKVRSLKNADGQVMNSCTPGNPVEVEGWKDLPPAGEIVLQVESEKLARMAIKVREEKKLLKKQEEDAVVIASKQEEHDKLYKERLDMKRRMGRFKLRKTGPREKEIKEDDSGIPSLNLLIKSDVDGTLEALLNTVDTYDETDCLVDLVNYGVGAVTANDIELAKTFDAVIYGFNITCTKEILEAAKDANVKIKLFNVIYKLIDDIKEEINTRLPPVPVEETIGEATVLQQFDINEGRKKIPVAGSRCTKGNLKRSAMFRLVRNEEILFDGSLSSMRHLKNEVDTIKKDLECGLQLSDKDITFKQGDTLICYVKKMEPQKTSWDPGF